MTPGLASEQGRRELPGVVLVCAAGALWGTAPIAFDIVHDGTAMSAAAASAYRLAIAGAVLWCLALLRSQGRATLRSLLRSPSAWAIGIGTAGYQVLWFQAITLVGASIATVLSLGLAPLVLVVWESVRTRTLPAASRLGIIALALIGLTLVCLPGEEGVAGDGSFLGIALAVLSGVAYAATTLLSRRAAGSIPVLHMSTVTATVGALCLAPLALLSGNWQVSDPAAVPTLLYLGVVTMALASIALHRGLRTASASTAGVATLLEPAVASLLAVVILGEILTPAAGVGLILILAATVGLTILNPDAREMTQRKAPT